MAEMDGLKDHVNQSSNVCLSMSNRCTCLSQQCAKESSRSCWNRMTVPRIRPFRADRVHERERCDAGPGLTFCGESFGTFEH